MRYPFCFHLFANIPAGGTPSVSASFTQRHETKSLRADRRSIS